MQITLLAGVTATPDRGTAVDIDSGAFLDWLADASKCPSVECADDAAKLRGDGFVFAQYADGAQSKGLEHLRPDSATDLLCFDVDDIDVESYQRARAVWERIDGVTYTTWKHTPQSPRVRVVVRQRKGRGRSSFDIAYCQRLAAKLGMPESTWRYRTSAEYRKRHAVSHKRYVLRKFGSYAVAGRYYRARAKAKASKEIV